MHHCFTFRQSSVARAFFGALRTCARSRRFHSPFAVVLLGLVALACDSSSGPKADRGGLVVFVESDLSIPKDIDHVTVVVTQSGKTLLSVDQEIGADHLLLPATFRVASPGNTRPVQVHGVASKDGTPRIERSAITSVPSTFVGEIHLPFDYLCDGTANADGTSTCPDGQTCKLGTCNAATVPKSEVTPVTETGQPEPSRSQDASTHVDGGSGDCFDVVACMQDAPVVSADPGACTVPAPTGSLDRINVALVLAPGSEGVCNDTQCWVVLDRGSSGWSAVDGQLALPPGACREGRTPNVAVSTACRSKQSGTATCGDWSSATEPIDHPPPAIGGSCDGARSEACGNCGKRTRSCVDGVLSGWSTCVGEGECKPADTRTCDTRGAEETCGADCHFGACTCPTGQFACNGACVASDDVHDCGRCGHDCTSLDHVTGDATCKAGACAFAGAACQSGWADCDGKPDNGCETDLSVSAHCGACTTACDGDGKCASVSGKAGCVATCPSEAPTTCGTSCVDTTTDPSNCSACGKTCPAVSHGQATCTSGACAVACNSGYSACDGTCVDVTTDAAHCGSCTQSCSGGQTCQGGTCGCPGGSHNCAGACVANTSAATCGSSCTPCTAPAGGTAGCDGTECTSLCAGGQSVCAGKCVDEQKDGSNCGACGKLCPAGKSCSAGVCSCSAGTHLCGSSCASNSAVATCGASCAPCAVPAHGTATCDGTACGVTCAAPYTACNGACIDVTTDQNNCGGCGASHSCAAGTCQGGVCHCAAGGITCGGACEAPSVYDNACGTGCNDSCPGVSFGRPACSASGCDVTCDQGYSACNGACVDLYTDYTHCGGCDSSTYTCPASSLCINGACRDASQFFDYPAGMASDGTNLYWANGDDPGSIATAGLDGIISQTPAPRFLVTGLSVPGHIVFQNAALYWTNGGSTSTPGSLMTYPLPSGPVATLASGLATPAGIAVSATTAYWTNQGTSANTGTVTSLNLQTKAVKTLATALNYPRNIAMDAQHLYVANYGSNTAALSDTADGSVLQMDLDGSHVISLATSQVNPDGIAVDSAFVYFTDRDFSYPPRGTVNKVPIGGGPITTLASGQQAPWGIAVDPGNGAAPPDVYWTEYAYAGSGSVLSGDGTGVSSVFAAADVAQVINISPCPACSCNLTQCFSVLTKPGYIYCVQNLCF